MRRRALPASSKATAVLGLCVFALFVVARVRTDEHVWTQALWFVPVLWWLAAMWLLWGVSALTGWLARRPWGAVARSALLLACAGASVFVLIGVWRVHRAVTPGAPRDPDAIRVVHWNIAAAFMDTDRAGRALADLDADLVVLANARRDGQRAALLNALGGARTLTIGSAGVASRIPITRAASVWVGTREAGGRATRETGSRGWVVVLELAPEGRGAPIVVWVVDLPSEPTRPKPAIVRETIDAVGGRSGSSRHATGDGGWAWRRDGRPYAPPDLIIGDFNIPRASASLEGFDALRDGGYADAFAAAGWGRARSWVPTHPDPLVRALLALGGWHIDLALAARVHDIRGYALEPIGGTAHRAQVVDVAPGADPGSDSGSDSGVGAGQSVP